MDGVSAQCKRNWLAAWWVCQAVCVYLGLPLFLFVAFDGKPSDYLGLLADGEFASWVLGALALVSLFQWMYLHPIREPSRARRPVNLFWSMAVGGLVVAMLVTGLLAGVLGALHDLAGFGLGDEGTAFWSVVGAFLLSWTVGTLLLARYVSRTAPVDAPLTRVSAMLFTGTVVEAIAAIPLDRLARRKEDCVCARGTFWTILFGLAGGLVMLGPLVFLVLVGRRRRRWPGGRCAACGADVGDELIPQRCAHCGVGWAE